MFRVGKWAFLLLNKALKWGQETWIWAFYKLHSFEKGCSEWASGLSLAAQQSIGCSQEGWIGRYALITNFALKSTAIRFLLAGFTSISTVTCVPGREPQIDI